MTTVRYLLDTNIVSDLVRRPGGRVTVRIEAVGSHGLAVSIITAAELRFGCAKRGSARLLAQVEAVLGGVDVLPFAPPADVHYGDIRASLEVAGAPIGPNDLLIAAHARSINATLVTDNVDEFSRVPGLRVENWLEAG